MVDTVAFDEFTFYGDGGAVTTGCVYTSTEGWDSGAPIRSDTADRPDADGAFGLTKAYRSARPIRFLGALTAPTFAEATALWDRFAALQSDGVPFKFTKANDVRTLSAVVSLDGVPLVTPFSDTAATVEANLIAFDPVKYEADVSVSTGLPSSGGGLEYNLFDGGSGGKLYYGANGNLGRVEVSNHGTAAVWPRFMVTGQLDSGFYLQCLETGDIIRYDRVVPAGTTVSLDSRTGSVLIDGVSDASTYLTQDNWFAIPPMGTRTVQINALGSSSGSPTLTVTAPAGGWW